MSLTPEEVISKTFQPTRFAEGYNQDEVDDFLDEVVSTLRGMQQEIDDLEAKLKSSQVEVSDLKAKAAAAPTQQADDETPAAADRASEQAPVLVKATETETVATTVTAMPTVTPELGGDGASGAAGMLVLAQRLHDEHVRNGENQRDQLIAEARQRAEKLVVDAEETRATTLSTLELERDELQSYIDTLRLHEQEYRTRMRSFLQAQLSDLETQQSLEPDSANI